MRLLHHFLEVEVDAKDADRQGNGDDYIADQDLEPTVLLRWSCYVCALVEKDREDDEAYPADAATEQR